MKKEGDTSNNRRLPFTAKRRCLITWQRNLLAKLWSDSFLVVLCLFFPPFSFVNRPRVWFCFFVGRVCFRGGLVGECLCVWCVLERGLEFMCLFSSFFFFVCFLAEIVPFSFKFPFVLCCFVRVEMWLAFWVKLLTFLVVVVSVAMVLSFVLFWIICVPSTTQYRIKREGKARRQTNQIQTHTNTETVPLTAENLQAFEEGVFEQATFKTPKRVNNSAINIVAASPTPTNTMSTPGHKQTHSLIAWPGLLPQTQTQTQNTNHHCIFFLCVKTMNNVQSPWAWCCVQKPSQPAHQRGGETKFVCVSSEKASSRQCSRWGKSLLIVGINSFNLTTWRSSPLQPLMLWVCNKAGFFTITFSLHLVFTHDWCWVSLVWLGVLSRRRMWGWLRWGVSCGFQRSGWWGEHHGLGLPNKQQISNTKTQTQETGITQHHITFGSTKTLRNHFAGSVSEGKAKKGWSFASLADGRLFGSAHNNHFNNAKPCPLMSMCCFICACLFLFVRHLWRQGGEQSGSSLCLSSFVLLLLLLTSRGKRGVVGKRWSTTFQTGRDSTPGHVWLEGLPMTCESKPCVFHPNQTLNQTNWQLPHTRGWFEISHHHPLNHLELHHYRVVSLLGAFWMTEFDSVMRFQWMNEMSLSLCSLSLILPNTLWSFVWWFASLWVCCWRWWWWWLWWKTPHQHTIEQSETGKANQRKGKSRSHTHTLDSWNKQRRWTIQLCHDTTNSPNVNSCGVISFTEQQLGRSVPQWTHLLLFVCLLVVVSLGETPRISFGLVFGTTKGEVCCVMVHGLGHPMRWRRDCLGSVLPNQSHPTWPAPLLLLVWTPTHCLADGCLRSVPQQKHNKNTTQQSGESNNLHWERDQPTHCCSKRTLISRCMTHPEWRASRAFSNCHNTARMKWGWRGVVDFPAFLFALFCCLVWWTSWARSRSAKGNSTQSLRLLWMLSCSWWRRGCTWRRGRMWGWLNSCLQQQQQHKTDCDSFEPHWLRNSDELSW